MSEFARQAATMGGSGARQDANVLRLPSWVLSKIATRGGGFTGQLRINFYLGGVTNIEWRTVEKQPISR